MALAGCCRIGSEVRKMTVSAQLHFCGSGTLVICNVLSQHAWSRCSTSCWLSKSSTSISDYKVHTPGSSLSTLLISRSESSSSCVMRMVLRKFAISNTTHKGWVGVQTFDWQWKLAVFLNACASALSRCASWFFCELYFLTWLAVGSMLMKWSWGM